MMLKKYFVLGLFLISAFVIAGCNTGASTGSTTPTTTPTTSTTTTTVSTLTGGREYYPNTDGNSWTYATTSTMTTETGTLRYTFDGTTTVDSIVVQKFKQESFSSTGSSTGESLDLVSDAGVFWYGSVESPTTEAVTKYVFPLKVGETWISEGASEAEVLAIETVTVPAGIYNNCFKISFPSPTQDIYVWLAPNVGMVKLYVYSLTTTMGATMELTSKNF